MLKAVVLFDDRITAKRTLALHVEPGQDAGRVKDVAALRHKRQIWILDACWATKLGEFFLQTAALETIVNFSFKTSKVKSTERRMHREFRSSHNQCKQKSTAEGGYKLW